MRKHVLTIILLLAVVPMWSAIEWALLIGISDYPVYKNMDGASWGNIHGANDVLMIGNTLKLKVNLSSFFRIKGKETKYSQ